MPKLGQGPMLPYRSAFRFSTARPLRRADLKMDEAAGDGAFLAAAYSSIQGGRFGRADLEAAEVPLREESALSTPFQGLGMAEEFRRVHERLEQVCASVARLDQVCASLAWLQESVTTFLSHPFFGLPSPSQSRAKHSLHVSVEGQFAVLDGRQCPLTEGQALVLKMLLENEGNFVSSTDMAAAHPMLEPAEKISRRDIKTLPEPIPILIHSVRGKGACLRLS